MTKQLRTHIVDQDKELAKLKASLRLYKTKYKDASRELGELVQTLDLKARFDDTKALEIGKSVKKADEQGREATAVILASDWHVGARVDRRKVMGLNHFNPKIAEARAKKFFHNALGQVNAERSSIPIKNLCLWLGGDLISNYIHPELEESNYMTPIEETLFAESLIDGGLDFLANHGKFESINVICNVGNHGRCQDGKTEILTPTGWINISQIKVGDLVAAFDKQTRQHYFVPALNICSFEADHRFEITSHFSNEVVSPGHKLYYRENLRPVEEVPFNFAQRDFSYSAFSDPAIYENKDVLKYSLMTWIVADGTLVDRLNAKEGVDAARVQFKFVKQRKIDAVISLLSEMEIPFTTRLSGKATVICIYGDTAKEIVREWFKGKKQFPEYFRSLKGNALWKVIEILGKSDGTIRPGTQIEWSSSDRENLDIIQQACVLDGIPFKISSKKRLSGYSQKDLIYVAQIYPNGLSERSLCHKGKIERIDEVTRFYGVTTSYGTLITRREGKVALTGNTTDKIRVSTQVENSYEYSLYKHLESKYTDSLFKWNIPKGYFALAKIYGKHHLFHHGHHVKYMGGIGGITIPILKYVLRANQMFQHPIVHHWFGHFHQNINHPLFTSNGSLIGFDSYAMSIAAQPEEPKQAMRLIDSKRGLTKITPIFLE